MSKTLEKAGINMDSEKDLEERLKTVDILMGEEKFPEVSVELNHLVGTVHRDDPRVHKRRGDYFAKIGDP